MSDEPNYITPEGYERITAEIEALLRVERPRVVREVQDAAAQGDRSENAEYIYGKKRLREIDRRLNFLAGRLKHASVIDPAKGGARDQVFFGATVRVEDEEGEEHTWRVVGADEADPVAGRVSWRSPIGRALLKKRVGDTTWYARPDGARVELTVLEIRYA
ncbi:MAG: transcription elongation factor GreB [Polyangiales bacterium]